MKNNINCLPFAFIDLETTGLNPIYGDKICEVGIIISEGDNINYKFESLVNPMRTIPPAATAIHGITDEQVRDAPKFYQIAFEVQKLLNNRVIVAHNIAFDLSFVYSELTALNIRIEPYAVIDTLKLSRRNFKFKSNSLDNLVVEFGIARKMAHRALSDALAVYRIFHRFVELLNIKDLGMLIELQGGELDWYNQIYEPKYILPPALQEALTSGRKLLIRYVSAYGKETIRAVQPLEIIAASDYLYLKGYCELRSAERSFRLDRILELKVL